MKTMSELKYHYGLKMCIHPSTKQKQIIKMNSDVSRAVYNVMVAIDKELYQLKQVKLPIDTVQDRIKELEQRKKAQNHLANHYYYMNHPYIDSYCRSMAMRSYQAAWNMFRKVHSAGTPKFHKKRYEEKYQTCGTYSNKKKAVNMWTGSIRFVDSKHINLPKLGIIRVSGSYRKILDNKDDIRIGTTTISKNSFGIYYVSMQLGSDTPFVNKLAKTNSQIGIDLNTKNFLTTSEGKVIDNPRYYRMIKGRLAKVQRTLSRRERRVKKEKRSLRNSKNYQKQRRLVAKINDKIRNQRNNFLNVNSTRLINNHDLIVAENLKSKNMLKNHALSLSISDVGWRSFLQKLAYKADLYQRTFIVVHPKNTTQTCHDCGFIMGSSNTEKLTLKDREWTCPACQTHHIRDVNAAKNIHDEGMKLLEKMSGSCKKCGKKRTVITEDTTWTCTKCNSKNK